MARRRAISMAVNISQIAVWLGLVMTALPIVAENTTWTQQPQTYTKHVFPHCDVCVLHLGACEANRQNKCHESMEKGYKSFFESENIPIRCLPGYELQENTPPSKASEPCICFCEVPWQIIAIIATIIAFFSFLLNVHLLVERKKHRQNDFDEGGTGTSARQAARLNNTNRENGLQEVTTSNGIPMTKMGESNERSLLNLKDDSCYDKSSDKDVAENSWELRATEFWNPPAHSIKTFNDDPSPSNNRSASLGRETEMTPSEHSKKTQSEDSETSLFQKTVLQVLNIGSPSLSNDESSNDWIASISQQLNLPSEVRGSTEAGTSTEPSTLRRRRPFKHDCLSEVTTRARVEGQITTESHADESDYTDKSDSENTARGKHGKDSFSSSDFESDDDKPDGSLHKSRLASKLEDMYLSLAELQAEASELNILKLKLQSHEDFGCWDGFSLRGGYGEKTNVNNLSVDLDMPQTEQRINEENKKTESPSETSGDSDYEEICSSLSLCQRLEKAASLKQKKGSSSSDNETRYDGLTDTENSQGSQSNRDKPTEKASSPKLERGSTSSDETSVDESHYSRARAVTEIYPTHDNSPLCGRKGIKWNPMLQPPSIDRTHIHMTYMKIKLILLLLFTIFLCCVYFCINSFIDWFIYQIDTYSFGQSVNNFLFGLVRPD